MQQFQTQQLKVIRGQTIDGQAVSLTSSQPQQLGLFQSFLDNANTYSKQLPQKYW